MNKTALYGIIITVIVSATAAIFAAYHIEDKQTIPSASSNDIEYSKCLDYIHNEKLSAQGITANAPFLVQVEWNPNDAKSDMPGKISVMMFDNKTGKPLEAVTYDFTYKGPRDLGEINNRQVVDFAAKDDFLLEIKYQCDVHFLFNIDKVGDQSFLRTNPNEIVKYGNASPVSVEFRVSQTEKGRLHMQVFT